MDTKELKLFICLAETLHFGQAGERMHLSASAVSRSIKRIEEELGQRLLERDNRRVQLTAAGESFLEYSKQAIEQWHSFKESMPSEQRELSGEVSLYCSVTASYSLLSPLLERFRLRHPSIDLKLHTGDQADAIERVVEGWEDLAIASQPERLPSSVEFRSLMHTPLRFIVPRTAAFSSQFVEQLSKGDRQAWSEAPLILSERGEARARAEQWFRQQGIKPHIYAQVSGHEAIVSMVGLGFGVGVVPQLVLNLSPVRDNIEVLHVLPELPPFTVGLCARKQRLDDPLVEAFWSCAVSSYRSEI